MFIYSKVPVKCEYFKVTGQGEFVKLSQNMLTCNFLRFANIQYLQISLT